MKSQTLVLKIPFGYLDRGFAKVRVLISQHTVPLARAFGGLPLTYSPASKAAIDQYMNTEEEVQVCLETRSADTANPELFAQVRPVPHNRSMLNRRPVVNVIIKCEMLMKKSVNHVCLSLKPNAIS